MWIIAKFISKQLYDNIFPHKIEMNGYHYSEFAENLYPECEKSIFLTSLFTPKEWFDELYPIKKVEQIGEGKPLSEDEIPHHVKALSASPALIKRRVVILDDNQYEDLYDKEKITFLEEFVRVNKGRGVDTMFVHKSVLQNETGFDHNNQDYAIFDEKLLLIWERPLSGGEEKSLTLETDIFDNNRKKLLDIFSFDRYLKFYKSGEAIIEEVKNK